MEKTLKNQKGFTLIEIIAVLVILGILAAVAVPKFVDLQNDSREKSAQSVFASLQSAASLNFAKGAMTPADHTPITTMATLLAVMDPPNVAPEGWESDGTDLTTKVLPPNGSISSPRSAKPGISFSRTPASL